MLEVEACVVGMCDASCDPVLMRVTTVYLLESVLLYLALSKFLQQHQLGLLQSQLLLQLLNDALPLRWAALLQMTTSVTPLDLQKTKVLSSD